MSQQEINRLLDEIDQRSARLRTLLTPAATATTAASTSHERVWNAFVFPTDEDEDDKKELPPRFSSGGFTFPSSPSVSPVKKVRTSPRTTKAAAAFVFATPQSRKSKQKQRCPGAPQKPTRRRQVRVNKLLGDSDKYIWEDISIHELNDTIEMLKEFMTIIHVVNHQYVSSLVGRGVNLNAVGSYLGLPHTLLSLACASRKVNAVHALLQYGAEAVPPSKDRTIFDYVIGVDFVESREYDLQAVIDIAQIFITYGISLNLSPLFRDVYDHEYRAVLRAVQNK